MTERVTFFGEKGPDQSKRSHRLEVRAPEGHRVLLAWTGRPGTLPAMVDDTDAGTAYRDLVGRLSQEVRELGGGVLVEVQPTSGAVRLHRLPVNGHGEVRRALRLSPFTGDGDVDLNREVEDLQLRRGEHLIVPVSARAEERMVQLQSLLGDMGPDVEALVFHTLRSPSLEARLGRLEEAVELDRSGRSRARWGSRRWGRRRRTMKERGGEGDGRSASRSRRLGPLALALLALVLLLILAVGWLMLRRGEEPPADPGTTAEQPVESDPGPAVEGTEPWSGQEAAPSGPSPDADLGVGDGQAPGTPASEDPGEGGPGQGVGP